MLNRQERYNTIESILKRTSTGRPTVDHFYDASVGECHAAYLKSLGLLPQHRFFDLGCGYGRTAIALLNYLDRGNYFGCDLSDERIRLANAYSRKMNLEDRKPSFFVARTDNGLSYLEQKSFDFVWARAVFAHMPLAQIEELLISVKGILKPGGVFVFDHNITPDPDGSSCENIKDFYFSPAAVDELLRKHGYGFETKNVPPEILPRYDEQRCRMMKATAVA